VCTDDVADHVGHCSKTFEDLQSWYEACSRDRDPMSMHDSSSERVGVAIPRGDQGGRSPPSRTWPVTLCSTPGRLVVIRPPTASELREVELHSPLVPSADDRTHVPVVRLSGVAEGRHVGRPVDGSVAEPRPSSAMGGSVTVTNWSSSATSISYLAAPSTGAHENTGWSTVAPAVGVDGRGRRQGSRMAVAAMGRRAKASGSHDGRPGPAWLHHVRPLTSVRTPGSAGPRRRSCSP
jgi:hypothetical protein